METTFENSYDEVPYPRKVYRQSHARRLESVATLSGMKPCSLDNCRVLELGCASGWNIIPQAREFPNSEFIGIDASVRQIAVGDSVVHGLGLKNLDLRQGDILEIDESLGKFDYIIAHGVFSWVPPAVQDKILEVCSQNLKPQGVAYVSYNIYPGWHNRGLVRDMMLFHSAQARTPAERIAQAKAGFAFIASNCNPDTNYGRMLADELKLLNSVEENYFYHDHMEVENHPLYFREFIQRAQSKGLQYLSDSDFWTMLPGRVPNKARKALQGASMIHLEQILDFLGNNSFRKSLLCHADVKVDRRIKPEILRGFQLGIRRKRTDFEFDPVSTEMVAIDFGDGKLQTNAPILKSALLELASAWPGSLGLEALYTRARSALEAKGLDRSVLQSQSLETLAQSLLQAVLSGFLEAHVHAPRICDQISEKPEADLFARLQARRGREVTNLRHETVAISELTQQILLLLDGAHTHGSVVEALKAEFDAGRIQLKKDDKVVPKLAPGFLDDVVGMSLEQIRVASLLTA